MNVLMITSLYPDDLDYNSSGKTRALHDFARIWASDNDVTVIRPLFSPGRPFNKSILNSVSDTYIVDKVRVYNIPVFRLPVLEYYNFNKVLRVIKKMKDAPDIIISHLRDSVMFASQIACELGIPFVAGIHAGDVERLKCGVYRNRFKKVLDKAALIVFRSFSVERNFRKFLIPACETAVIPSGIDKDVLEAFDFIEEKSQRLNTSKRIKIFTAASLIPLKNIDINLRALSEIDVLKHDWSYQIAGDGPEYKKLMALSKQLHIENRVTFLGGLYHSQVLDKMKESDIYLMASSPETLGLSYLEAMAKGAVVIGASDTGIDGVIVNKENGFLTEAGNVHAMIKTLRDILQNNNLADVCKNAYGTVKKMTQVKMGEKYLEYIKKAVL